MPKTAVVVRMPRLSAKEATGPVLLAVPGYPPMHASGITTSRWQVGVVIISTTKAVICDLVQQLPFLPRRGRGG